MDELYVCILSVGTAALVLLLPIAADLNFHLDAAERKLYFGILLYGNIRLFGGYMEPRREGIAVHLSRKKAVLFPYAQMLKTRPDLNKLHGFRLKRFTQVIELGATDRAGILMLAAALVNAAPILGNAAREALGCRLRSDILICKKDAFRLTAAANVRFRLLTLLILFIKIALEAFISWLKTNKSTV